MDFSNATSLDSVRLMRMFVRHTSPYCHARLTVRVRYSRSTAFSGSCYYRDSRIFVNIGRRNRYPFTFGTHVAKAENCVDHWQREIFTLTVSDAYELALFVYLHELYHFLVKAAKRSIHRKEAMCDRFAVRTLVDQYECPLRDVLGRAPLRSRWDFQDLDGFVARAPRAAGERAVIPVRLLGVDA